MNEIIMLLSLGLCIALTVAIGYYFINRELNKTIKQKEEEFKKLLGQKKSSEVRLGQISENLAPFLDDFKYNPKRAHFLGQPIDYIIFEDDEIIFLEIKSGMAQLNPVQKSIKALIKNKKVRWDEMRINGLKTKNGADAGSDASMPETPGLSDTTKTNVQVQAVHLPVQNEVCSTGDGTDNSR